MSSGVSSRCAAKESSDQARIAKGGGDINKQAAGEPIVPDKPRAAVQEGLKGGKWQKESKKFWAGARDAVD